MQWIQWVQGVLENLVLEQVEQILTITILGQRAGEGFELRGINPAGTPGDFLGTGDLQPLPLFQCADELCGFEQ